MREMGWPKAGGEKGGDQVEMMLDVSWGQAVGGPVNHHEELRVKSKGNCESLI